MNEYRRLDEICNINMGQSPASDSYNEDGDGLPFFQGNADFGELYPEVRIWCNAPTKIVDPETLLISVRAPIGALNFSRERSCIGRGLAGITPMSGVELKYVYYCLKGKNAELNAKGTGSTFKAIAKAALGEVPVRMISLSEQQEIVRMLDRLSDVIAQRKQQLTDLDMLIKARFVEMFGDPVSNPRGWSVYNLLELGSCKNGMNFHYDDSGVEINCLGVGDFKDNSVIRDTAALPTVSLNEMPSQEYMLQDDDIVFVRSNGNKALVGRSVAVYPGDTPTTFSGFCIRYRLGGSMVKIPYLLQVLKAESMRKKMAGRGANIQNLNQQILGTLMIPIPPLESQNAFAAFVAQVDKSKAVVQKALDEAQTLFDSLMQEYFG